MLSYFQQVDLDWFGSYAKFTTSIVRGALAAIRSAEWSRAHGTGGDLTTPPSAPSGLRSLLRPLPLLKRGRRPLKLRISGGILARRYVCELAKAQPQGLKRIAYDSRATTRRLLVTALASRSRAALDRPPHQRRIARNSGTKTTQVPILQRRSEHGRVSDAR